MEWEHSGVKAPEDVGVKHLMICAKCHLPQLEEAEDSVAKEIVKNIYAFAEDGDEDAAKALQSLNIGCTVCHGRNAIVHKWKDGTPQKDAVYGTKDGEHEDENHPVMKESKIMKESIKSAAPRFSSRRMVKEYALSFYQDALRHAHENVPQTPESPKSMKPISPKR